MKFSYKAGVGVLALMALFSTIARGDATVISQTRTIDYYSQQEDSTTGFPIGYPQLGTSRSAPDLGSFQASVGNIVGGQMLGPYAEQTSSISGLAVDASAFTEASQYVTAAFQHILYTGDSGTSVTYQLDSSMTYQFFQGYSGHGIESLLGPNNQTIPFSGIMGTTSTGTIGPGQWTIQAIVGPSTGFGGYNFSFSLTPEPTTMGIVLVPLFLCRHRCRR